MKDRMRVLSDGTSLGMWLSQIRKAQGLTTQALAYRIGIDDGNLSRIENDRIQPTIQTIVAICDGLGIPWQQVHAVSHSNIRAGTIRPGTKLSRALIWRLPENEG